MVKKCGWYGKETDGEHFIENSPYVDDDGNFFKIICYLCENCYIKTKNSKPQFEYHKIEIRYKK